MRLESKKILEEIKKEPRTFRTDMWSEYLLALFKEDMDNNKCRDVTRSAATVTQAACIKKKP